MPIPSAEIPTSEMSPEDATALDGAVSPACVIPASVPGTPPVSPTERDTLGLLQSMTHYSPSPPAGMPMDGQLTPASLRKTPSKVSFSSSRVEETAEEEEGQFDDAEVEEADELLGLHPSEQPLPSSPSPSPSPLPSSLSLVDRMVEHILQEKHQVSEVGVRSETPDKVTTAVSLTGVPQYSSAQDCDDVNPMDTSVQEDSPNVLDPSGCDDNEPAKLPPLRYIPLPPNVGRSA